MNKRGGGGGGVFLGDRGRRSRSSRVVTLEHRLLHGPDSNRLGASAPRKELDALPGGRLASSACLVLGLAVMPPSFQTPAPACPTLCESGDQGRLRRDVVGAATGERVREESAAPVSLHIAAPAPGGGPVPPCDRVVVEAEGGQLIPRPARVVYCSGTSVAVRHQPGDPSTSTNGRGGLCPLLDQEVHAGGRPPRHTSAPTLASAAATRFFFFPAKPCTPRSTDWQQLGDSADLLPTRWPMSGTASSPTERRKN